MSDQDIPPTQDEDRLSYAEAYKIRKKTRKEMVALLQPVFEEIDKRLSDLERRSKQKVDGKYITDVESRRLEEQLVVINGVWMDLLRAIKDVKKDLED